MIGNLPHPANSGKPESVGASRGWEPFIYINVFKPDRIYKRFRRSRRPFFGHVTGIY